jgi:NTE family protein
VTDQAAALHRRNQILKRLLDKLPDSALSEDEQALKQELTNQAEITILHLIYHQAAYEGHSKDYEFSAETMRVHWDSGYRDAKATLSHRKWLVMPPELGGIHVHDVHRPDES